MQGMAFGADIGKGREAVPDLVAQSTCAVCVRPVHWNGDAWEHETTGLWASAPVRHQAIPTPPPRAAETDRQDKRA